MIIRVKKDKSNPYVIIDKRVLNDATLSWRAKGMLAYLLSLPDDWQIYQEELVTHSTDGITSLRSGLKELEDAGYLKRVQARDDKGRYVGWDYEVHEIPVGADNSPDNSTNSTESSMPTHGQTSTEMRFSKIGHSHLGQTHTTNNNINQLTKEPINIPDELPSGSHQAIVQALSKTTGMDMKIRANAGRIVSAAKQLREAGYTADHIQKFGELWKKDWRFRQNRQPPALTTIISEISKVKDNNAHTNTMNTVDPETRLANALAELENSKEEADNDKKH